MTPARTSLSPQFVAALAVASGFALFLVWDQWHWWGTKPDYVFGYIVPLFVAYVVYDRWPRIRELAGASAPATPGGNARWWHGLLTAGAGAALAVGLAMFFLGAIIRANSGASQPASLAMAVGFAGSTLALVYLAAGTSAASTAERAGTGAAGWRAVLASPRVRLTGLFLFPALVWVISAPLVSAVEDSLSGYLQNKVAMVVAFVFDALGLPLQRDGNTFRLPEGRGEVGVAEACSGIRSLTGSIFSAAFLGAVFMHQPWKKIALLAAAVVLAFLTNIVRSLFLTGWAYAHGSQSIEGAVHDVSGFAVLGVTFCGLLVLVWVLNFRLKVEE